MSRYRLIFEGEFDEKLGLVGVAEQVAMRMEGVADLRLVRVYNCLAGCLVCRHGEPIDGTFYTRVACRQKGMEHEREATDHCMRFVQLNIMDKQVLGDPQLAAEVERRIEKFNKLVRKTQ